MLSKWDELRLIARCVAGDDRHAFERLVDEYNDGLRRFLLNFVLRFRFGILLFHFAHVGVVFVVSYSIQPCLESGKSLK